MLPDHIALLNKLVEDIQELKKDFREHQHTDIDGTKTLEVKPEIPNQGSISDENTGTVDNTYGLAEAGVLSNVRTRVGEIEDALIAFGLLS